MPRSLLTFLAVASSSLAATIATAQIPPISPDFVTGTSRAEDAEKAGESEQAIASATKAIDSTPTASPPYAIRARALFRLGRFQESVADFDRYVQLEPAAASRQWERGIALYYAGQYAKGAEQFALYQTYHAGDFENSAWRYLCVARSEGVDKARENLLPIEEDRRVPMMALLRLYRGEGTAEQVFEAVEAGDPDDEERAGRLFYAQLYVGLHHEAAGRDDAARTLLLRAADDHVQTRTINRYMHDVARVHAEKLRATNP